MISIINVFSTMESALPYSRDIGNNAVDLTVNLNDSEERYNELKIESDDNYNLESSIGPADRDKQRAFMAISMPILELCVAPSQDLFQK